MSTRTRIAILISGRGSNMVSLIEAAQAPDYPAEIGLVASNRPDAPGLARAAEAGLATAAVDHRAFSDRAAFERALDAELRRHGVELLVLAGFMRVLTPWFVESWAGRMINIHPSLLPLFRGTPHMPRRWRPASGCMAVRCISWCPSSMPARSSPRPPCRCCRRTTRTV